MLVLKRSSVAILCVVGVFFIFGSSLAGGFVFDDRNILDHAEILGSFSTVGDAVMAPFWDVESGVYRPVVLLSYVINSALGFWPELFHLFNLFLYAGVCYLIFLLVGRLAKNRVVALLAALLFLVLPIHTEAVVSISNRTELLAALFLILALLAASAEKINYWLLGLWVFLALGSKESAVAVVPLVLLVLYFRERSLTVEALRTYFRPLASTVIGAVLYFFLRFFVLGPAHFFSSHTGFIENPLQYTDTYSRVLTGFSVLWMYVEKVFWPVGLCADYSYNQIPVVHTIGNTGALLGVSVFLIMVILAVVFWRKQALITVALAITALSFLPASNILFPTGTIGGERLFFLPSLGICIVIAYAGWGIYQYVRAKFPHAGRALSVAALLAVFGVLSAYGYIAFMQQKVWHTEKALFMATAQCAPNSVLARSNLGATYYLAGDFVSAKRELEYARNIEPVYSKGLNNLGLVYWKLGDLDKAEEMYLEALSQDFPYAGAYENLTNLYLQEKRYTDAERWLNLRNPNQAAAVDDFIMRAKQQ